MAMPGLKAEERCIACSGMPLPAVAEDNASRVRCRGELPPADTMFVSRNGSSAVFGSDHEPCWLPPVPPGGRRPAAPLPGANDRARNGGDGCTNGPSFLAAVALGLKMCRDMDPVRQQCPSRLTSRPGSIHALRRPLCAEFNHQSSLAYHYFGMVH
jgi:hypothetical protein